MCGERVTVHNLTILVQRIKSTYHLNPSITNPINPR